MSLPTRTWHISVSRDDASIFSEDQARVLEASAATAATRAEYAALDLLDLLGIELVPCCGADPDDPPCPDCAAELAGDAIDRAVHEAKLRRGE